MEGRDIAVPSVFVVRKSDRAIVFKKVGENMTDRPTSTQVVAAVKAAR